MSSAYSLLVRRWCGLVPVGVLTVSTVVGVLVGLHLSHGTSPRDIADRLGCTHVHDVRPQPEMNGVSCEHRGSEVLVLRLDPGGYSFSGGTLPPAMVIAPEAAGDLVVECQDGAVCAVIQDALGGELVGGSTQFGLSLRID